MRSSLDLPDLPVWQSLPDYSPTAAARIVRAYAKIASGSDRVASYLRAANEVTPCLAMPMALPQRLRICYVEASAYAADDQGEEALKWTEEAVDLASGLNDWSALSTLLYPRGALNGALLRFTKGAADYNESRTLLREHSEHGEQHDIAFDLHLTIVQASSRFFLGQYEEAQRLIDEARGLVPLCSEQRKELATIAWVEANLFRWRGSPELALRPALAASEVFTKDGPANSAARIQTLAAEVALDFAAALPQGSDRNALVGLARPHVAEALRLVNGTGDLPGAVLASLTEVRCLRLEGANVDRLATLEHLVQLAHGSSDAALLGQVVTGLGDELAAASELEAARSRYREALRILDDCDLRALRAWPWRALNRPDGALRDLP